MTLNYWQPCWNLDSFNVRNYVKPILPHYHNEKTKTTLTSIDISLLTCAMSLDWLEQFTDDLSSLFNTDCPGRPPRYDKTEKRKRNIHVQKTLKLCDIEAHNKDGALLRATWLEDVGWELAAVEDATQRSMWEKWKKNPGAGSRYVYLRQFNSQSENDKSIANCCKHLLQISVGLAIDVMKKHIICQTNQ